MSIFQQIPPNKYFLKQNNNALFYQSKGLLVIQNGYYYTINITMYLLLNITSFIKNSAKIN